MFLKKNKTKQTEDTELLKLDSYCPECDASVVADETGTMKLRFCPDCGAELAQPSYCIWCDNLVDATARFCTGCGMMIKR